MAADQDVVSIPDVTAISDGLALICLVKGQRVGVPFGAIARSSEVKRPGDQGTLVITVTMARNLGLL